MTRGGGEAGSRGAVRCRGDDGCEPNEREGGMSEAAVWPGM